MRVVKRRKAKGLIFAIVLFVMSVTMYTLTSIYLKQYNNQLSINIQTTQSEIATLSNEKQALQVEIDKLSTKNKVVDAVDSDEMSQNKDNIVYIDGSND